MVSKKTIAVTKDRRKLKLKKETLQDLDARGSSGKVKGGVGKMSLTGLACICTTAKVPR